MKNKVVHRRYDDRRSRPDLRELVRCNNINGPLKGALLTSDPKKVTCGRCIRIEEGVRMNAPPFSNADLRRISHDLAPPMLCIEIVESATNKVEKKLGPYASARLRDKADAGLTRTLDHAHFFTRFAR